MYAKGLSNVTKYKWPMHKKSSDEQTGLWVS